MPKVSVIVPIYKVEPYLERCVESIQEQTLTEIEIILVDDGSPDRCPILCDEYAKKDPRIRVIHKQNEGLGLARDSGMDAATGEYVGFIDSDDYIAKDFFEKLYNAAAEHHADACIGAMVDVYDTYQSVQQNPFANITLQTEEIASKLLPAMLGEDISGGDWIGCSACRGIYSREVIQKNNVRFPSERVYISEDAIFNLLFYKAARSVHVIPEAGYYYCHRTSGGSLTTTYNKDRFEKNKVLYRYECELAEQFGPAESVLKQRMQSTFMGNLRVAMMQLTTSGMPFAQKYRELKGYVQDDLVQTVIHQLDDSNLPIRQKVFSICLKNKQTPALYFLAYLQQKKHLAK